MQTKTMASTFETAVQVREYCNKIGSDSLLVQGPGGNVSWKDGDVLWVKASGTWLAHANGLETFIPVDLAHLRKAIVEKKFSVLPKVICATTLKPSIETMLHAVMPHKVVAHLHAVEILAHLVRENPLENLKRLIGDDVKWIFVDYHKPGAELAEAVSAELATGHDADVAFLKNHGLVIGGARVSCIEHTLCILLSRLKTKRHLFERNVKSEVLVSDFLNSNYVLTSDVNLNLLATNNKLASRLQSHWALYPDHVVFLGEKATVINNAYELSALEINNYRPHFIFIPGVGVYENVSEPEAHKAQLRCYYDVLARQSPFEKLTTLTIAQISEILNWDAEKYRQSTSK